ncbi:MAG: NAD(P)-binding domain-containing protein [Candidatus Zixiibacteriota bacterium]
MESIYIWLVTIAVSLVIVGIYFRKFLVERRLAAERKDEARALGIDRPRSQFPFINPALCIGCGTCTMVCPEGDVIGIVHGAATIINGERCVGHGACERECPVGAIKVGLGDVRHRPDIPVLTPAMETTVPGIFIAGELSGISLIRNAVQHGKLVIEAIAARKPAAGQQYQVLIVGAGPAGITAALRAQELGLQYLLIDQDDLGGTIRHYPRNKLVMTQPIEFPLFGPLKNDEYSKEFLIDLWNQLRVKIAKSFHPNEKLIGVTTQPGGFLVSTNKASYTCANLLLAIGRRGTPRQLNVSGEELPKVMYQLVDAQSYTGRDVLVVGGGDSAIEAAVGLARQANNRVTISYRRDAFYRVKKKNETAVKKMMSNGMIKVVFDSQVQRINSDSVLLTTKVGDVTLVNDYVFVFAGGDPPYEWLKGMGIKFGGEAKRPAVEKPATTGTR